MPPVNIRTSNERLAIIDRAVAIRGTSRTEFVLRSSEAAAIEVKSQLRYDTGMLLGLRAIEEFPGTMRRALVYDGKRSFRTRDGIDGWSTVQLQ